MEGGMVAVGLAVEDVEVAAAKAEAVVGVAEKGTEEKVGDLEGEVEEDMVVEGRGKPAQRLEAHAAMWARS